MSETPRPILQFLRGKRIAVAGVSRSPNQAANAVFRKLRESGYEAVPINPNATEVEGTRCYSDLRSIPGKIDGLVIAAHPSVAVDLVRQCEETGVSHVWFHRSFGEGSVSDAAVRECESHGIECIVGGCPLMFLQPVDIAHRCMGWWLLRRGRIDEGHLQPAGTSAS